MKTGHNTFTKRAAGFTLVETIIAMGIITVMITAFIAAFGPAVSGINKSISVKEANRLASSLEVEMGLLRADEYDANSAGGKYSSAFEKAYQWIKDSHSTDTDKCVLIYQYRGDPSKLRDDGTMEPYIDQGGVAGRDYVLQAVVRRLENVNVQDELKPRVLEGRVFYVRMKQMIYRSGVLELTDQPTSIIDPEEPRQPTSDADDYPRAVIALQAEFFVLGNGLYDYLTTSFSLADANADGFPDATGKPVFTRNLAVSR